jgi:hypothetical protein
MSTGEVRLARMIPPVCSAETRSPGEVELFERFQDEPGTEGWVVLHSLDLSEHVARVSGEVDFVVIVPGSGVVSLEVKAHHSVRRHGGIWFLGGDQVGEPRGPFKQAAEASHSLRESVTTRVAAAAGVPFWSAVALPYVSFDDRSPEWHDWQVIDKQVLSSRSLSDAIVGVLRGARTHLGGSTTWFDPGSPEPTPTTVDAMVTLLRGDFEVHETPKSRRRRLQEEVLRYTEEQAQALDQVEDNDRVVFDGPAGTGKTVLAVEAARRAATKGARVLLLCFNRNLAVRLAGATEGEPGIIARTIHAHMLRTSGEAARPDPGFWSETLPELALERALERDRPEFDVLVIDEAQDIARTAFLDVLDLELEGGLADGRWLAFGDLANQVIYDSDADLIELLRERGAPGFVRFNLTANCRNTPRIAGYAQLLGDLARGYRRTMRPDDGIEPRTHVIAREDRPREVLAGVLSQLADEGFTGPDVVVLSPMRDGLAGSLPDEPWGRRFARLGDERASAGSLRWATIHEFKGLEAPAVVITDVGSFDERTRRLLYVGATRALHRLHVLVDEPVRDQLVRTLTA